MSDSSTAALLPALAAQFNKAQKSAADSRHATAELKHLFASQPELYTCDQGLLNRVHRLVALAPARRDTGVERLHALVAQLLLPGLTAPEEGHAPEPAAAAATACLLAVLPLSAASDKNVRLQVCRLALAALTAFAEAPGAAETDLLDAAWSAFRAALLPRLKDKQAGVRAAAATALRLLQVDDAPAPGARGGDSDASSSEDDATGAAGPTRDDATLELLRLASGDSSKDVRLAAVASFQLSSLTLAALVAAARDVSPEVRCGALQRLATEVDASHLPKACRAQLAGASLRDRVPAVRAQARQMVLGGWLRRAGCDPVKLLALLDCAPASANGAEESGAVAAVCGAVLDAAEDFSHGAVLSDGDRAALGRALDNHALNLKVAAADASRACGHGVPDDDDAPDDADQAASRAAARQRAAGAASGAAFALLAARAGRAQRRLKGARKEDALEKLLPEPAAFADLLTLALGLAAAAAVRADAAADAAAEAAASGAKATSPLVASAHADAKATAHEAKGRLAAALCAVRVVAHLDQQDEAGRGALRRALEGCALEGAAPDALAAAAVRGLAHVVRGGQDFPAAAAKLLAEALQHADAAAETAHAEAVAGGGSGDDATDAAADARAVWDIRRGVLCAAALRAAAPGSLSETSPAGSTLGAAGACLEGHLVSLLTSDFDDARRHAVAGLGSLALLDPQACRKWLPALANVALCAAEGADVRTAALHALSDLCHASDDAAAALADPAVCAALPDAAAWHAADPASPDQAATHFFARVLCALLDGDAKGDGGDDDDDASFVPLLAAAAAEAGAKLLLAQRLQAGGAAAAECGLLLSRLVAVYFRSDLARAAQKADAATDGDTADAAFAARRAQQVLSVFFPAFAREKGAAAVVPAGLDCFLASYTAAASRARDASGEAAWSPLRGACPVGHAVLFFVALLDSAEAADATAGGRPPASTALPASAAADDQGDGGGEGEDAAGKDGAASAVAEALGAQATSLGVASTTRGSMRLQASLKLCAVLVNHRAWAGKKGSASATARKQLAKALGAVPVAASTSADEPIDVELLKLCGLWARAAMDAVAQLDGAAAAKPVGKFIAAAQAADPRPGDALPGEFTYDAALEILVANPLFGGAVAAEQLAALLAGSSNSSCAKAAAGSSSSSSSSNPAKGNARGGAVKRRSLKDDSSSSEEADVSEEDEESDGDEEVDEPNSADAAEDVENGGAGNAEAFADGEAVAGNKAGSKAATSAAKASRSFAETHEGRRVLGAKA